MFEAIIGLVTGFFGTCFFVTTGLVLLKKKWVNDKPKNAVNFSTDFKNEEDKIYSEFVKESHALIDTIATHKNLGNKTVSKKLLSVLIEVKELVKRVKKSGSNGKLVEIVVKYGDIFKKLNLIFGEKVYLDAQLNPKYYDNPTKILNEAEEVLTVVYNQVIDNIKQVNKNDDIDFKVAMEALTENNGNSDLNNVFESLNNNKEDVEEFVPENLTDPSISVSRG